MRRAAGAPRVRDVHPRSAVPVLLVAPTEFALLVGKPQFCCCPVPDRSPRRLCVDGCSSPWGRPGTPGHPRLAACASEYAHRAMCRRSACIFAKRRDRGRHTPAGPSNRPGSERDQGTARSIPWTPRHFSSRSLCPGGTERTFGGCALFLSLQRAVICLRLGGGRAEVDPGNCSRDGHGPPP